MERIEQAIILAAGEGQRLKPFTGLRPKVMLPIANKPILQYVVEALADSGIRHIVMVVGYRKEQVQDYFGSGKKFGVDIHYVVQEQQLGTAHALRQAKDAVKTRFLVLAGDNIIGPETIAPLVTATTNTILVKTQEDISKYGVVIVEGGWVKSIVEKPKAELSHLVNTGIYAFSEQIFDFVDEEVDLPAALEMMVARGYSIAAEETSGIWLDAVYPWDILRLNDFVIKQIPASLAGTVESGAVVKGQVSVGESTIIRSGCYIVGPVVIGENCDIGPSVCILPATSIGNSVIIASFTQIKNSLIASEVSIGPNSSLQDSIIAPGSVMEGHFVALSGDTTAIVEEEFHRVKLGTTMGDYCQVGENVVVYPGSIIGNSCQIKAMKVVRENLGDNSLVV